MRSLARLLRMMASAALLCRAAQAEEESILTSDVIVVDDGLFNSNFHNPEQIISGGFKNFT